MNDTDDLARVLGDIEGIDTMRRIGRVRQTIGLVIESDGPPACVGELCEIYTDDLAAARDSRPILAEVVGFRQNHLLMMPFGETEQIRVNSEVVATGRPMQIPVGQRWLCRRRHTAPQIGLTPTQRAENVRGAFTVAEPEQVAGKRLILIDDVLTTGATARDAARALKSARAAAVYLLTVSIAPPDWHPAAQHLEPPGTSG